MSQCRDISEEGHMWVRVTGQWSLEVCPPVGSENGQRQAAYRLGYMGQQTAGPGITKGIFCHSRGLGMV